MRNTILFLTLLTNSLFGQNEPWLSGSFENYYGSFLFIDKPHKTGAIEANQVKLVLDDDAGFNQSIDIQEPGFIGMFDPSSKIYLRFWLEPGKELGLAADWNELVESVSFNGQLGEANKLTKQLDLNRAKILKNTQELSWAKIKELMDAEERKLKAAYESKRTSIEFFDLMSLDSRYFWTNQALVQGLINSSEVKSQVEISNDLALKSRNYFSFLRTYFQKVDQFETLRQKYSVASEQLSNRVFEFFWAYDLRQESMTDRRNFELLEVFKSYKDRYGDEKLISYIYKYLKAIENEYYRMNTPISKEMELVQNTEMTIQDVINKFKGEVLYFDMWATWCKPCIMEMDAQFKKPLEGFIKNKPIKIIYLSGDVDSAQEKWAEMVKDMRLNSFNIRMARDKYVETAVFLGVNPNIGFGIPRYFIVDKEGNLVNANAPRPSDGEKLYKELSKYL